MSLENCVYTVYVPDEPKPLVFNELHEVKNFLNSPKGKSPGITNAAGVFIAFLGVRFRKCQKEQIEELDPALSVAPSTSASVLNEPAVPYKAPPVPRLSELRRTIERKDNTKFDEMIAENPRFLINMGGDNPTIIFEGCRYNSLHVAARAGNLHAAQKILSCVADQQWLARAYGSDAPMEERANYLTAAFLNTPDKSENNTPLHYACKFGFADVVRVLLQYSSCAQHPKNK